MTNKKWSLIVGVLFIITIISFSLNYNTNEKLTDTRQVLVKTLGQHFNYQYKINNFVREDIGNALQEEDVSKRNEHLIKALIKIDSNRLNSTEERIPAPDIIQQYMVRYSEKWMDIEQVLLEGITNENEIISDETLNQIIETTKVIVYSTLKVGHDSH